MELPNEIIKFVQDNPLESVFDFEDEEMNISRFIVSRRHKIMYLELD